MYLTTLVSLSACLVHTAIAKPKLSDFDWATIEPSESLNYSSCYDGQKCAKLLAPLDWLDPVNNTARVTLAIIARPAVVAESDPSFGGSIIVNPGGPSGSGVSFVLFAGEVIQNAADGNKKYEILSFDPRGVGLTEPRADCYQDEFARSFSTLQDRALGPLDSGLDAVRQKMAVADAFGRLCEPGTAGDNIRGFMSTSSVARDMVEIVDRLHELRNGNEATEIVHAYDDRKQQRLELRSGDKTPRIQYWGFSYGTVIGNYFASMFPGRVGRMILEGVVDVDDYADASWALNLVDTSHVLAHFWETCFEARNLCALYRGTDKSPKSIQDRVEALIDDLSVSPEPYLSQSTVDFITKQDMLNTIFRPLYQPQRDFPGLATILDEALTGNYTKVYAAIGNPKRDESCPLSIPETYTWAHEAQNAIACGDGKSQANLTISEFLEYLNRLKSDSPEFGARWSGLRVNCKGWRVRPRYRFTGPWTSPEADVNLTEGKPAAPLLFVSSRYDPVTPLANAFEMSKAHPGSRVLIQENAGHGSLFSPGKCREDLIKKYFETGELPQEGTTCKPDCKPFHDCPQMPFTATAIGDEIESSNRRPPLSL